MAQADSTPESATPAPTAISPNTAPQVDASPAATAKLRSVPIWLWPLLATALVSGVSQTAGPWWAAIVIIGVAASALATLLGVRTDRPKSWAVGIAVIAAMVAVALVLVFGDEIARLSVPHIARGGAASPAP